MVDFLKCFSALALQVIINVNDNGMQMIWVRGAPTQQHLYALDSDHCNEDDNDCDDSVEIQRKHVTYNTQIAI